MSSTSEHIHREKLDMHAWQFFLGMKLTQNCLHKFDANEPLNVSGFETRLCIGSSASIDPDGSGV